MKKSTEAKILGGLALVAGVFLLSGCTANFCSDADRSQIAYAYEQGVTVYCDKEEVPEDYADYAFLPIEGNDKVYAYIPVNSDGYYAAQKATYLTNTIISTAVSNKYVVPGYDYFKDFDQKVLNCVLDTAEGLEPGFSRAEVTAQELNAWVNADGNDIPDASGNEEGAKANASGLLRKYGYLKFYGGYGGTEQVLWANYDKFNEEIRAEYASDGVHSVSEAAGSDYLTQYKNSLNTVLNQVRTCLTITDGSYGAYGANSNWAINITGTTYGGAWGTGFLEGLIEYPVVAMLDSLAYTIDPYLTGIGQILALCIVTLVVRFILMAVMFHSTMSQQKQQMLQPQIAKIQAKYPNSNTNQTERARLSQETMALYKRNKINMWEPFLVMIIQFPVFIAVWGALSSSAVLSTGSVLNLNLAATISSTLTNFSGAWYTNQNGWWTALVLFILMAGLQFVSMMLPQWITKYRTRNQPKLVVNEAAKKNQSTQRTMMIVMFVFTVIMGFALPAAMGVYWAIGALVSMIQTCITQAILARQQKKQKERR